MCDCEHSGPLVKIEPIPITPPRKGHAGEAAYLALWQRYFNRLDDDEKAAIFRQIATERLTQRQASVAASFVLWLGTNCGRGMIREADRGPRVPDGYRSGHDLRYLRAWEMENRREVGINHGIRYVEAILSEHRPNSEGSIEPAHWPTVTLDDLDAIECICRWLATQDGQHFLRAAEAKVEAETRAQRLFGEVA